MGPSLIILGLLITGAGVFLLWGGKFPLLPGDIFITRGNMTFYFPIVTSIVVSIILSLIIRFFR